MVFFEESYASYSTNQISRNIRVLPLPNLQYHGWVIVSRVFEVIMTTTSWEELASLAQVAKQCIQHKGRPSSLMVFPFVLWVKR
jgi:hypothetical protein